MSSALVSTPPRLPRFNTLRSVLIGLAITSVIMLAVFQGDVGKMGRYAAAIGGAFAHPHLPDFTPLVAAGPVVMAHVVTVVAAMAIGAWLFVGRKGRTMHRVLGWLWVGLMVTTALVTLFIRSINPGAMSFIHIFSGLVLVQAPLGLYFARRHNVKGHRQTMTGLFIGAIVIAGIFTFLPGRIMYSVFFG